MNETSDFKLRIYQTLVADERVHDLAWTLIQSSDQDDGPRVLEMDVAAGRRYLRQCILNMTDEEVNQLADRDAAALWARGARGAASYRKRGK